MFRNYLLTAFRSLARNKSYTLINIAGLVIGIAVCLVIFIIIRYESGFDNFHGKKDRIYRVMTRDDKGNTGSSVPFPLPAAMKHDFPTWQTTGMFSLPGLQVVIQEENGGPVKKFREARGAFLTDESFFGIFDFPWLAGNPATALQQPNSAVLTKEIAEKYFGSWEKAVGRQIKVNINNGILLTVTGVLASIPSNTDFPLRIVIPYKLTGFSDSKDWITINSNHKCFVLLPPHTTVSALSRPLDAFSKKYRPADNKNVQVLQPLGDIHFDNTTDNYSGRTMSPERTKILWLIAVFILSIACVNFINLSTAQAVNRAKEIGVRKVLGSNRWQINMQFLLETLLQVITGMCLAVIVAAFTLKPVSNMLGISLSLELLMQPVILLFLLVVTIAVTILAGFYPALVLAGFNPVAALKSRFSAKGKGLSLRKGLVVFQFVIAQVLIIGTLLLIRQIDYFKKTSMGFNTTTVVDVPFPGDSAGRARTAYLKDRLMGMKEIEEVSFNNTTPASADNWWTGFKFDHAVKETEFGAISKFVDAHYLTTYQLPLVAGRNISSADSIHEFLINETLAKKLGYADPRDVLNKDVDLWNGTLKGVVVGVTKDFHSGSLKEAISPVFMANWKDVYNTVGIRMAASDMPATMKAIGRIWNEVYPDFVFEYQFLDDRVASFYDEENQLSRLYRLFSGIAIFLSCLGLYGLASFMAVQRIKEVGIRKVLGATAGSIVYLFSKDFIVLIAVAFIIACPVTWYFMDQWLQQYTYHISIGWWVFLAGGLGAVIIALLTVSFQAVRAALANPAVSLKAE